MKIFWSWQSDNDQDSGRYFVRDVLNKLAKTLNSEAEAEEAERDEEADTIKVDHDTKGVGGSPIIAETILRKIKEAAVFVADVTPIGLSVSGKKQLANPNVMIELGYALLALGHERIVLVMNEAENGSMENLPFDLRHWKAPAIYSLRAGASKEEITDQSAKLQSALKTRVKDSLAKAERDASERKIVVRAPVFKVEFTGVEGALPSSISQHVGELGASTPSQIKVMHPKLQLRNAPQIGAVISRITPGLGRRAPRPTSLWTDQEIERYNVSLESFYAKYQRYLDDLLKYRQLILRTLHVELKVSNIGTLSGNNIDVELDCPNGMLIYEPSKYPREPEAPSPPLKDPDASLYAHVIPMSIDIPRLRGPSDDWTKVDGSNGHVRFHVKELKHGFSQTSDSFYIAFATAQDIGNAEFAFRVSANEIPTLTSDSLALACKKIDD
ncbi:MAG: hypothetical protein ABI644_02245 [Arenimonas sp.]